VIGGCVQRLIALVGCATILLVTGALAWQFRDEIRALYHSQVESRVRNDTPARTTNPEAEPDSVASMGVPSRQARRSAERKEATIGKRDGPAYVVFNANEMAALVDARLDPAARRSLDSLRVSLGKDRFTIHAQVRAESFGDILGPLAGFFASREPLRATGPARLQRAGVVAWRPEELFIRTFPVPGVVIPRLVNHLTGHDDGAFHITVPPTVGDLRIRADGVTFYRWVK
jgi:hypothetical protein